MPLQGCHVGGCSLTGAFELADGYHYCVGHALERAPGVVLAKTPEQLRYLREVGSGWLDPAALDEAKRRELQNLEKSFADQSGGRTGVCEAPGCRRALKNQRARFCGSICRKRFWRSQQPKRSPRPRGRKRIYASGSDRVKAWRQRKRQAAQQAILEAERRLTPEQLRHKQNAEAFAEKLKAEQRSRRTAMARRARSKGWPPEGWPSSEGERNWSFPSSEGIADHTLACKFCGKRLQKGESFCDGRCLDAFLQKDDGDAS